MTNTRILTLLKEFLFPVLVVIVILPLTVFLLIPKTKEISAIQEDIAKQEKQITILQQKLTYLQSLSETELFDTSSLLLEALPAQKDFYKILTLSKKIFRDNNSFLKSFDFSPGVVSTESAEIKSKSQNKNEESLSQMRMDIDFKASYDNFSSLLLNFGKVLPLIEINAIKFSTLTASGSGSMVDLEGRISLQAYFAPLPKTLGKIDSPLPVLSSEGKKLTEKLKSFQRYQPETESSEEPVVVGKENPFP